MNNKGFFNNNITRAEELKIRDSSNNYMIGKLEESNNPTVLTERGAVRFNVTSLCSEPSAILDIEDLYNGPDNFFGFDNKQDEDVLPDFYYSINEEDRQEEIVNFYDGKLMIFHPSYSFNKKDEKWFKNLYIDHLIDDNYSPSAYFTMIPRINMEPKLFEQTLANGEYFDLPCYDSEINDSPEYIICGSYIYKAKDNSENLLMASTVASIRWKCQDINNVVKIDLTKIEDYRAGIVRANDNIAFLEANLISRINLIKDFDLFEIDKAKVRVENELKLSKNEPVSKDTDIDVDGQDNDEVKFLKGLEQLTIDNGLQYKFNDLINFHTSIKTSPLVILAGMSGTGKSRLAMNYAKMLDLSEDNGTLLFLPISPSYTEPSDVLGYLNSMNGLYIPSESGLVQFLKKASDSPDQMFMVIFDEMNLSQVEYWFSPFISILEKDREGQFLSLYSSDAHCINSELYPAKIKIGENVIFIGTVNIDDTTKNFSDRLLDRTFVINLDKVKFTDFYYRYQKHQMEKHIDLNNCKCKTVSQFKNWVKSDNKNYITAFNDHFDELKFFDDLNDLISKYIPDGGISHRVMKNIGNYILNVPEDNSNLLMSRDEVIDIVVKETIMTKIRGSETQLNGLIGHFNEKNELVNSEMIDLLAKNSSISKFEVVKNEIRLKAEELRVNGFAI